MEQPAALAGEIQDFFRPLRNYRTGPHRNKKDFNMAHDGLRFGIFLAPFHRVGDNPNLALQRDLELVQWLDHLGYDEAWIGEHHSAGWETIASPEIFIGVAADRTRNIMLGSGVTSLPYHHPLMVAQRFVQLDHMTRGRSHAWRRARRAGVGRLHDGHRPGNPAPPHGRIPRRHRARCWKAKAPVTLKTDWFELKEARLHLRPYTKGGFPDRGRQRDHPRRLAGRRQVRRRHAVDRRRRAGRSRETRRQLAHGGGGGRQARPHHQPRQLAPRHQHALCRGRRNRHARSPRRRADRNPDILLRNAGPSADAQRKPVAARVSPPARTLVGSPETIIDGINRMLAYTGGGAGAVLFRSHEWANREQTLRSYELFARWVMPRFQGSAGVDLGLPRMVQREPRRDLRSGDGRAEEGVRRCRPGGAGYDADAAAHREDRGRLNTSLNRPLRAEADGARQRLQKTISDEP